MSTGKRARVTLRDVAERAGVSPTTASFVLSGRRDMRISAATEERVFQAARTLDYRRLAPGAAVPATTPAIGVVCDAAGHFAGEMLRGCVAAATDHGHVVLTSHHAGLNEVAALLARGVRKFVHVGAATVTYAVPGALRGHRLVTMNNADPASRAPAVIPDDAQAGRAVARALTSAGHTTGIWLVGQALPRAAAAVRRLSGIRTGLRSAGLRPAGHVRCGWFPDETRKALAELFDAGWWERACPTALIAMDDRAAMGVYQAVGAAGLSIPRDVSVISFDDSGLARWLHPGLSSMDLPWFGLGRRAVELLLAEGAQARVHRLPAELRTRESVGPPSR
ncbi:substrate-binding domain-containing protein [Nonomuraea sp. NPDC050404]|uniref:substrate-binding domain-containing protein n=1 Tax=Nonomuraea sp. NPDC050404 TaxID=3155783 RepID=UPI0033CD2F8F